MRGLSWCLMLSYIALRKRTSDLLITYLSAGLLSLLLVHLSAVRHWRNLKSLLGPQNPKTPNTRLIE